MTLNRSPQIGLLRLGQRNTTVHPRSGRKDNSRNRAFNDITPYGVYNYFAVHSTAVGSA
jgi:hypothetical protein